MKIFQSFSKYGSGVIQKGPTIVYKIWITILVQRYVKHIKGVLVFNSCSGEYCGPWLSSCYRVLRRFHSTIDFTAVRRNIWLRTIHSVHSCISRTTRGPIHIILQHSNENQPLINKLQRSIRLKDGYNIHMFHLTKSFDMERECQIKFLAQWCLKPCNPALKFSSSG